MFYILLSPLPFLPPRFFFLFSFPRLCDAAFTALSVFFTAMFALQRCETIGNFFNLQNANEQMLSRRRFPDLTRRVKSRRRAARGWDRESRRALIEKRRDEGATALSPLPLVLSAVPQDSGGPWTSWNDVSVEISFRIPGKRCSREG